MDIQIRELLVYERPKHVQIRIVHQTQQDIQSTQAQTHIIQTTNYLPITSHSALHSQNLSLSLSLLLPPSLTSPPVRSPAAPVPLGALPTSPLPLLHRPHLRSPGLSRRICWSGHWIELCAGLSLTSAGRSSARSTPAPTTIEWRGERVLEVRFGAASMV